LEQSKINRSFDVKGDRKYGNSGTTSHSP